VQALFAEVEELEFPREVLPHYVFGCLSHGRFVDVPVDPGEYLHLVPIDIFGAFEEAGDIVLQHSEGLVELFEDPDDRVVLLNILLRLSHRYLRVEASE